MVTDQLKQAYEAAQKRSFKEQDMLASKILAEIEAMEEREWNALFASPRSLAHMRKMTEEIEADISSDEIEEGGFDCLAEPAY